MNWPCKHVRRFVVWVSFPHHNIAAQGVIGRCTFCHCMASKLELAILLQIYRSRQLKDWHLSGPIEPYWRDWSNFTCQLASCEWVRIRCSLILGPQLLAAVCKGPQPPQKCVHAMSQVRTWSTHAVKIASTKQSCKSCKIFDYMLARKLNLEGSVALPELHRK